MRLSRLLPVRSGGVEDVVVFLLRPHAAGVRLLEYPVAGAALPVPPPAIACSTQRPSCAFFRRAFANRLRARRVVALAAGWGHDRVTEEMTSFHPDAIDVADA